MKTVSSQKPGFIIRQAQHDNAAHPDTDASLSMTKAIRYGKPYLVLQKISTLAKLLWEPMETPTITR